MDSFILGTLAVFTVYTERQPLSWRVSTANLILILHFKTFCEVPDTVGGTRESQELEYDNCLAFREQQRRNALFQGNMNSAYLYPDLSHLPPPFTLES